MSCLWVLNGLGMVKHFWKLRLWCRADGSPNTRMGHLPIQAAGESSTRRGTRMTDVRLSGCTSCQYPILEMTRRC